MEKYKISSRFTFIRTPYGNIVYIVKQRTSFYFIKYWKPLRLFWQRKDAEEFLKTLT